jgi:potassium-transporting ATPase KdpC subunit
VKRFFISLKVFLFFSVLTGIVYPLLITGVSQIVFPEKANGSLILKENIKVGSKLIGQQFNSDIYFIPRPSAVLYNPLPSGGSNYGLTNARLVNLVAERKKEFIYLNQLDTLTIIPSEMLFASASGLDPHISQKAALLQVDRIVKTRNLSPVQKQALLQIVKNLTEPSQFLMLGEERVNVLCLNIELNKIDQNNSIKK